MPNTKSFPHLTLVLGGARSGKSAFAETLVTSANRPRTYIATSQPFDEEMETKIANHRESRGPDWHTIEAPLDLNPALVAAAPNSIVLIDCLTLWLSNQMHADADIDVEIENLLLVLNSVPIPVVCVSNEVGMGLVPETKLGRRFRDFQGKLNQKFAEQANLVVFVAAGLPLTLKGSFPGGIA